MSPRTSTPAPYVKADIDVKVGLKKKEETLTEAPDMLDKSFHTVAEIFVDDAAVVKPSLPTDVQQHQHLHHHLHQHVHHLAPAPPKPCLPWVTEANKVRRGSSKGLPCAVASNVSDFLSPVNSSLAQVLPPLPNQATAEWCHNLQDERSWTTRGTTRRRRLVSQCATMSLSTMAAGQPDHLHLVGCDQQPQDVDDNLPHHHHHHH